MTSYLDNGYDVMKYFAKFEKFIPHSIIIPSFMTIGSQVSELEWGLSPPPYKIGSQNTPYKLELTSCIIFIPELLRVFEIFGTFENQRGVCKLTYKSCYKEIHFSL